MSTDIHGTDETIGFTTDDETGYTAEEAAFTAQEAEFDHSTDLLGEFLQAASDEIDNIVSYPVTNRPGDWSLEFNAMVSEMEIKHFNQVAGGGNRAARRGGKTGQFSNAKMCALILTEKNTGIYKGTGSDRQQVFDEDGDPLRLNSLEFIGAMGHPDDVVAAIREFLGDAGTATMGGAVLREAGWSEDLTPLDPTER